MEWLFSIHGCRKVIRKPALINHLLSRNAVSSSSLASMSSAVVSNRRIATLYLSSASGKSSDAKCALPSDLSITTADSMASKLTLITSGDDNDNEASVFSAKLYVVSVYLKKIKMKFECYLRLSSGFICNRISASLALSACTSAILARIEAFGGTRGTHPDSPKA